MSLLDKAMKKHMAFITNEERRTFSYTDFLKFEVDGIKHEMSHGTFRNKISKLRKSNKIEVYCSSTCTFYTLKGNKFSKYIPDRTVVTKHRHFINFEHRIDMNLRKNKDMYNMFKALPFDKQCIHNIRLKFVVPNLWSLLSESELELSRNSTSKDISVPIHIPTTIIDCVDIKLSVHKTNTVTIIIGCSLNPISLDTDGIIMFYTLLAVIQEQLRTLVNTCTNTTNDSLLRMSVPTPIIIPDNKQWIITLWHFGMDSLTHYAGERYSITSEEAQGVLIRLYSKKIKGKYRIRAELQEYPQKTVADTLNEIIITNANTQKSNLLEDMR